MTSWALWDTQEMDESPSVKAFQEQKIRHSYLDWFKMNPSENRYGNTQAPLGHGRVPGLCALGAERQKDDEHFRITQHP